jgi:hypothetical protein
MILLDQLAKDGFTLKQKKFVRDFEHGRQVIHISFISTSGLVFVGESYYQIIFEKIEKIFKTLFGKHWTNWTVHEQIGSLSKKLYDEVTASYTDKTLNEAANPFFSDIYPKVKSLNLKFKSYEQLNLAYNEFPGKNIDCVPSNRFERRILMGLLLTKYFEPHKYEIRKSEYLERFEEFDPFQREQQRTTIDEGIRTLNTIDLTAANKRLGESL